MCNRNGKVALAAVLTLWASSAAFGQDPFPEPNTPAQQGSVADEAQIGTIEARTDGLGVERLPPQQDMHGAGERDERISGDGTGPGFDPQRGRAGSGHGGNDRGVNDRGGNEQRAGGQGENGQQRPPHSNGDDASPYRDLEPGDPGLDEPRQPIRPGQMEQERDRSS